MCRTWSQSVHSICPENIIATVFAPGPYHYLCGWGVSQLKKLDEGMALATDLVETNKMNALGRALSEMIHDAWWPRTQSALETIQVARDAEFHYGDSELRQQAFTLHAGPANSKHTAEDVFAHLSHITARSNKGFQKMNKSPDSRSNLPKFVSKPLRCK